MAYDEALADRVREQLAPREAVTEQRMFGGLAFLVAGHMAVCVSGDGLMVRLGADAADAALDEPHTRPMDMTGRPMKNWIVVAPEGIESDAQLADWVGRGVAYAQSLPPKA